ATRRSDRSRRCEWACCESRTSLRWRESRAAPSARSASVRAGCDRARCGALRPAPETESAARLLQPLPERANARGQQHGREHRDIQRLAPEILEADAFEHDAPRDDDEPPAREDERNPLEKRRHALNGKDEPG